MVSKYPKFIALSLVLMLIISSIAYFVMLTAQNYTPLARMKNAQDVAKMSGEYQFRTDIDQVSGYAPSITNYGRESRHDQMVVEGTINESTQTSTMTISNANGVMLEVRRERGQTYARRPGTGWQRAANNSTAQINTLSYLAGMTNAKVVGSDGNSFDFGFDGNAFATHFARLLSADAAHGIKYSDEWYSIAQSNQFKETNGNGNLTLDSDGLPKNMTLNLTMPGNNNNGTVQTSIKTSFFAYARTGLALKKVLNNPFTIVGNLLGTDTSAVKTVLFSLLAVLAVTIIGALVHLFRRRLYLPVTLLALGMLVFQPFSNIPRSYAATSEESVPTPGPDSTTPSKPEVTFNPLVSPLAQAGSVVLPNAGTTTANDTVVVSGSQSRSLTTRDASSPVSCTTLTDSNKNMDADDDGLTNEQECVTYKTLPNNADSDDDGLNDFAELKLGTLPKTPDSDLDGLNDFAEVQLGTNSKRSDSDFDGLSDYVEVATFTQYPGTTNKFYTNPLKSDTNGDGIRDAFECPVKIVLTTTDVKNFVAGPNTNCEDTNGDKIPDFITFDNDGDGVSDSADSLPSVSDATPYSESNPYLLKIQNTTTTVQPLTVDFQIRPTDNLLYANNAVYDWPNGDTDGQVTRVLTTTFQSSPVFNSPDASAKNGDIKVTAMLEIKIPISSNQYGNLPVTNCSNYVPVTKTLQLNSQDANSCVNLEKTRPYGMSVSWSRDGAGTEQKNSVTVSVPLNANYDANGTIMAYSGQAYYETGVQTWSANHEVRLQWIISALQDYCPSDKPNCSEKERLEYSTTLQSYYSGFKVVGINATESYGAKAAVIYEDSSKSTVTTAAQRRFAIIKSANYLNAAFVKTPFLTIDGSDTSKSIPVIFDNTKNQSSPITSTVKDATKVIVKSYATSLEIVKISSEIETKILNGINKTACTNSTTVNCRPAMIIANESTERVTSLTSNKTIDFATIEKSVTRGIKGVIYKLDENSKWQVASPEDYAPEITAAQNTLPQTQSTTNLSADQVAEFSDSYIMSALLSFRKPQTSNFAKKINNGVEGLDYLLNQVTAKSFISYDASTTNWNNALSATLTTFQAQIEAVIQKEAETKKEADDAFEKQTDLSETINDNVEFAMGAVEFISESLYERKIDGSGDLLVSALTLSLTLGGSFGTDDEEVQRGIEIATATIDLVVAIKEFVEAVDNVITATKTIKTIAGAATAAKAATDAATKAASTAGKLAKGLAVAGVVLQLAVAWAVGIMTAMNADYAYQKGNAIASMIGQTLAIIFIAVISQIPVFGQLIAAVLGLLDGIAAAACAGLSEKDKRSTASKWLCGGATGILANFFTPYASNIVIDPDDAWSRYKKIETVDTSLVNNMIGFRVGNGMRNTMKVTDYVERMPFPSSWQALFWAWQWNALDERSTSTNYVLGPQTDFNYSISVGSQVNQWQRNSTCPSTTPAADCAYYKDGEKTYSWRKPVTIAYTSQFTDSGINTKLPDLYVSQAIKVPQQTCISIPIWFIFIILIPFCWIETHTANPDYTNINDGSPTNYDLLPATIDEFVSMRLRNEEAGYTFAWSPDTAEPPFPVFTDADNDGLSNEQEKTYGTRDNTYDSDGDGISDNREVALTTNPVLKDSDNDGLTDDLELQMTTNPSMPDSDGDGLLDGEEVMHVEKGIRVGGWEVTYAIIGNQPQTTWISSDPLQADADGDQITDLREKVLGWSPYAKNSGDIMTASGSVREALLPTIQVGFDSNSISTAFSSSGFVSSNLQCVNTSALTTTITCPTVTTTTDRTLPNSTTMNPYVTLASAQSLDVGNGPQSNFDSQFTIAAWLKPSAITLGTSFIRRANLLSASYTSTGAVLVRLGTTKGIYTITTAASVLPTGSWKHLAFTYGNQALVVYVDGVEVGRAAVAGNLITTPNQKLIVGNGYAGGIDDIAVYQVALRAGEITQLKNGALAGGNDLVVKPGDRLITSITQANKLLGRSIQGYSTISSVSGANGFQSDQIKTASLAANTSTSFDSTVTVPGAQNLSTTPSTYANSCVYAGNELCVKFDEALSMPSTPATAKFTDLSSQSNNLTCASTLECPVYQTDGSWAFNKSSVKLNTNAAVGNAISAHDFTIAAWVRPEGQATTLRTIVNSSNTNALMQVALANERPQFSMGSATALVASNALNTNSWSHVLYTFAAGKRSIYVNGVIVATDATAIAYPGSFGVLNVGKDAGINSFNGSLRDLQIYSNALNLRQITALANTCEDPQLIGCMPLSGSTSDMSVYGAEQGSVLSNAGSNGVLTSSATMPVGYAKLISDHDFTMVAKVRLGSTTANQTIMQTATAVGSGNQFKVATNGDSVATLSVGTLSLTAGSALVAGGTYVIAARYQAGLWTLRVNSANGSNLQTTSNSNTGTTLRQAQEPISIGQSGMTINNIRIYRTAVSDTTLAAVARYALFGTLSVALNNPPVSDLLQISVDSRGKVINPDANFERIRGNCEAAVVCLPFTSWDSSFPSADMTGATATQSTDYSSLYPARLALDGNRSTFTHTSGGDTNPWLEINLGSSKSIRNLIITNRIGCCPERIANAIVFLSNTSLGTSTNIATNKTNSVAWKNIGCDDQAPTCTAYKDDMYVRFPVNIKAQFIRIQLPNTGTLSVGEVKINQTDASICQSTGACPTISNGGANFTTGKRVSITPEVSKATFEGSDKNFTVMTWVRFNAVPATSDQWIIVDRGDVMGTNLRLHIGVRNTKLYYANFNNDFAGTTTLQPNTWYHVAFVKDGTSRSIYLNGVLEARNTTSVAGLVSAREMFIGEMDNGVSSLNGSMRDFQIHNTALNIDATLLTADIAKAATTNAFELQVPFDEPAVSTQFSDVLTTGLSLSCLSATDCPLSGQPGRDDRAVHFDGGQGLRFNPATNTGAYVDYINKTTNPNYTISMWVRPSAYGTWLLGNDTITQKLRVGINKDGYLSYEQGRDFISNAIDANRNNATIKWPAEPLLSSQKLPLNSWSHITVSIRNTEEYVFVNGVRTNREIASTLFKDPITAVAGSTTLSTTGLGQTIVNNPLSTNASAPTVINEMVALANNKSTTVSGYAFNNTTKAISLGQSHPLNGATSATIGMWVKPTNLANLGGSYLLSSASDYQFYVENNGQLWFALDTSTNVPAWTWNPTGITFTSDKWQYFSMVLNANEPDANKKLTFRIDQADGTNPQIKYHAATGYIKDNYTCDLLLGANCADIAGRRAFTGSIGNLFITPRALSDTELATLRSEPLTLANARKYGNADAPAPTVNLAETFAGDLDELHISPIATTAASTVQADMKQAPNWNLTFEESLNLNRTELDDDGKSKVIQINAVTLPSDVPGRAGINRFSVAASCDTPEISGVECPVGNTVGMAGTASLFNGTNTMLQVGNGNTLIDEIKNGGTIQLMIKPDKLTGTQTLLHYGNTSGNTAFQVQIVEGQVKFTIGSTIFTSSTKLAMAWNQISFSFGANGLKYFQNGTEQDTRTSASKPLFASTVINSVTYPIATQSSTCCGYPVYPAQLILDGDINTFQHTSTEAQPWLQIDLGTSTDINSLDIYNRSDNYTTAGFRIGNGIIFASDTSLGTRKDIAAMKTTAGVVWRNIGCNDQATTCTSYAQLMTVTFPAGTKARYLRLQSPDNSQFMHLGEIKGEIKYLQASPATITTNSGYKLRIGGKISGSNLSEMFQGGIDEITFTPSTLAPSKVFRIARSQFSQAMTKTDIASVTIDAEPPVVSITNPNYVARLPQQFVINTSDVSSYVANVTASITSTRDTSGNIINTAQNTAISVPACIDATGGSAYCPTFGLSQVATVAIEGKYGLSTTASDIVGNVGSAQSTILVDTTPPTAALIRPTGPITTTYKTTWAPNENMPELTIKLSASDPVLTNSGNSAGSGVKSLSVNLKDAAGRLINKSASIPATLNAGVWTATIPVPFGNPSGFYQVGAIVTDNVGNQSNEIMVANANTMIEVDASAPRDVITYPSPYNPDNYFVGNQTITGRVSDIGDGRTALQQGLRIRLDFEAPDGAQAFDNRADSRYNTSCSTCPVIAPDGSSSNKIARFNIDNSVTAQQSLTVANAATVLTGTFSIALMAKINDVGTLISTGVASNPRLRIQVSKVGSAFQVTAKKGNVSVKTPATLVSNTWYYLIYSEYRDGTTSSISLASGSNLATLTTATATYTGALPPVQPDITIGAMQSTAGDTRKEDFFRGYIDDVLLSPSQLVAADLIGKALAQGSGTQRHLTRLAIDDDGYTGNDRLTDSVDFYMPMNQSSLPIVDAIKGLRSSRCTADTTVVPNTCPLLSEGFASNAVLLQRNSDGIKTDYQLQTSASTAKSMALRFKIGVDATSGLLAWLQAPGTSDSLAMQIGYNKDLQSVTVRINDKNATLLETSEATTAINDNDWHTMVITSTGSDTNEQISVYIDGTLVVTKTIAGHWVNATLGLGALTDVSGYSGRDTTTAAAINTASDDLAIFSTALTSANIIDYSFGYSTVYHETFDNGRITPGAITSDDSPYHQPSTITSGDANLNSVVGTVGSAAIAFDGNDEVIHRDLNTLTFAPHNQPWSLSVWVTPKNICSEGAIIEGTLNNFSYELLLTPCTKRPIFSMAGMYMLGYDSPLSTSSASHIIVSSDGTTLSMYVNGTSVASTATSIGSNVFTRTPAIIPFDSKSQSSTDGSNPAGNGYDGNLSTYSLTTSETNPYWVMSNPSSTAMDNVTIYSRVPGKPLSNFTLFVSDTLPDMTSSDRFNLVTTASKWSYRMNGTVSDRVTIPLPIGTTGKHVIIIADGANRTIALNDVQITLLPTIKIGTGFTGTIDDVRIYRKALTAADRFRLGAMAWQQSATTTENGYTTWSRPAIAGVEVNTSIQSMTVDNNDNSLVTAGERSLWQGTMDSFNPRITTTNVDGNYTVNVSDRNLSPQQMATPCGNKLTVNYQLPPSLWFLQNMSVLDGTYNSPTSLTGSCTFASVPELIRTNSQVISTTNALVYGNRYGYVGGINNIAVVDVLAGQRMTKGSVTVAGTVNHLIINEAKTKLYAISTAGILNTLTIFDIATNPTTPAQLGALAIPSISAGATVAKLGITTNQNGDWYLILADTSSPQKYFSIDVSSPRSPTIATTTTPSIDTRTAMDMAAQNDLVVVAYGDTGIIIYRVADGGALNAVQSFNSTGYANKLFFNGNSLAIFSDDEPSNATTTPTSANVLITMNLIASVSATGEAALTSPLAEQNSYMHSTPIDGDNVNWYRMVDGAPYRPNEFMVLSADVNNPGNQRISIINTAESDAYLVSDTQLTVTTPLRVATNSQSVAVLARQAAITSLTGYQVSDARLSTYACDILNNCTTVASTVTTTQKLGIDPPLQASVRLINQVNAYTTGTQRIYVSGEAPLGISEMSLVSDTQILATIAITGTPTQMERSFDINLPSGIYTLKAQLKDGQANVITSPAMRTVVDLSAPQIKLIDGVIGESLLVNNYFLIRAVITDDIGLDNLQIINTLPNAPPIPYTLKHRDYNSTCKCVVTDVTAIYNRRATDAKGLPLRIIANDAAGRSSINTSTVIFDTVPPVISDGTVKATLNGVVTPLTDGQTVSAIASANLNVGWSKIADVSPILLNKLEYTVKTLSSTTNYSATLDTKSALTLAAGQFSGLTTAEASRMTFALRVRDSLGNELLSNLPSVYVDAPTTPDYTLMNSTEPTYRGFINNGCAALGEDRRPGLNNIQRFAMTWDSQAIRLNWQGANWDYDGDLFIYLDTVTGGTVKAYRPTSYTQSISNSVALGESFITLPVNMAVRSTGSTSSVKDYVNSFQTALSQSRQGNRAGTISGGADYVIHVKDSTTASILRWNGSDWVDTNVTPSYRAVNELGIEQTDIRALFSSIGYVVGQPLGVVAFATTPTKFMPWTSFPITNPIRTEQGTNPIAITPMLNGFGWSNLNAGVCPKAAALNPDTTQVITSLTSTPNGVFNRALADSFTNTEPDAISQIISDTAELCDALTTNNWCTTVTQYGTAINNGSGLLDALASTLASEQDPVVGNNSVVTYTLTIQNPTNKPTRTIYGIVQTYGGIWLTNQNSTGTPATAIIGGGNYDYHSITASNLRDYQVIRIAPMAANSSQTLTLQARIDPSKAQPTDSDRIKTSSIAKIEVRLTDDSTGTTPDNINIARTIEWLNAAVAIDSSAPERVTPDTQTIVKRGAVTITGGLSDASSVPAVNLEYYTNVNANRIPVSCGASVLGRWSCPVTVPNGVSSLSYRVRASDVYNQQSQWSPWYNALVDVTAPSFGFTPQTTSMFVAAYVGGSAITLGGTVSDTNSIATIKVCDESQPTCDFGTTTNPTTEQSVISNTVTLAQEVTAQPCAATEFASYTMLPNTISTAAPQARVGSLTVDVNATSLAADELNLWLQSPSGTLTPLMTSVRSGMVNFNSQFSDSASTTTASLIGTTSITGTATLVESDGLLSRFGGEPVNGTWQLLACDRNENSTRTTINQWKITLTSSGNTVSNNAPWTYTVKNTANIDNQMRVLKLYALDNYNNLSPATVVALTIDTAAPSVTVTQLANSLLPGSQATLFQGTLSDGGSINGINANVYDSSKLVQTVNITTQSVQSQTLARMNYLQGRAAVNYTWQLPIDASTLTPGTYRVQFVATDVAGNQRTTDAYTFTVTQPTAPSLQTIQMPATHQQNTFALQYVVDTGSGPTTVVSTVALDGNVNPLSSDTTLQMWDSSGVADSTAQAQIPTSVQNTQLRQLEMNNHLAATLDNNGTLTTWELQNSNTVVVAPPTDSVMQLSNVTQFAMGDSSNQHLLTLSSTGVITDYTPTGATTVAITDAVAIAAGTTHNLAIIKTGQLVAWGGTNSNGETTIPISDTMGISQIAAGDGFSLALKSDGRLIAWGKYNLGQTTVPVSATTGIMQIAAGDKHGLALRADGVVVAWGDNSLGQITIPISVTNALYIAANANSSAAVTRDGKLYVWGATTSVESCCYGTTTVALNGTQILTNQVASNITQSNSLPASLDLVRTSNQFTGLLPGRRYKYTLTVSNSAGSASYSGTFTPTQSYDKLYLPFLTNTDGATAVNTTSGK
jgi:hypothetical protein